MASVRDMALLRSFWPTGLAWRVCAICERGHETTGACPTLKVALEHVFEKGDLTMGSFMALVFGPRGATMSEAGLRTRFAALRDQLDSAESLRQQAATALAELRVAAARAGLAAELRAMEHPEPQAAVVREAATVRVRVKEGFSTEHQGIPYYAQTGEVLDLPDTLATRLAKGGLVERVAPSTPLHQVQIRW